MAGEASETGEAESLAPGGSGWRDYLYNTKFRHARAPPPMTEIEDVLPEPPEALRHGGPDDPFRTIWRS